MQLGHLSTANAGSLRGQHRPASQTAQGLLFAGFNQDFTLLAIGTDTGFRILTSDPLSENRRRGIPTRMHIIYFLNTN